MDRLKQLASDVADAGREARERRENETDACLAIVDEFCAELGVVEVAVDPFSGHHYEACSTRPDSWERITVFLPRKVPTLLEVQTLVVAAWDDDALSVHGRHCEGFAEGMDVFRAAIKREQAR